MCSVISSRFKLALLTLLLVGLAASGAVADAIILKSGRQMNVAVREISDNTVYFVSNGDIHSLPLTEVKKILIAGEPGQATAATPAAGAVAAAPTVPAAPPVPPPALELVNTASGFDRGVLTVQGEVRNNTAREIKFVQLIVTLHDEADTVLTTSYLYAPGPSPHLQAGESRAFRASFLNPPPTTYKYKVRAESRYLGQ